MNTSKWWELEERTRLTLGGYQEPVRHSVNPFPMLQSPVAPSNLFPKSLWHLLLEKTGMEWAYGLLGRVTKNVQDDVLFHHPLHELLYPLKIRHPAQTVQAVMVGPFDKVKFFGSFGSGKDFFP